MGFPGGSVVKNLPPSARDPGSIHGQGRSPEVGNGNLLQYSCLGDPVDRGPWHATVHGIAESDTAERVCGTVGEDICPVNSSHKTFCHPSIARSSRFIPFWKKKKKTRNLKYSIFFLNVRDFSGGPLVKNPPWDVGDTGSIPGWRTGIPHAEEQLSPCAAITGAFMPPLESLCPKQRSHMMQWRSDTGKSITIF